MSKRCQYGYNSIFNESSQFIAVSGLDIAHKTVIDLLDGSFFRTENVQVGTGHAKGIDTEGLQAGDDVLIDQSSVDHGYNAQHIGIGNAAPANHAAGDAQLLGHLGSRTATAMHQQFMSFDGGEVVQQTLQGIGLFDDFSAHLDKYEFFHDVSFFYWSPNSMR